MDDRKDSIRVQDSSHIDNVEVAHEHSDINVRAVFWGVVGLAAVTAVVFLVIFLTFRYFEGREAERSPREFPLAPIEAQFPPEPRVQARPSEDMRDLRRKEDELLRTAWVDERTGTARIPIDHAMKLVLERNLLPVRPQTSESGK
jgi:hypothetical protein